MNVPLNKRNQIIYFEMMSHPALFSHHSPQKIAILGDSDQGILNEALKHGNIEEIWTEHNVETEKKLHLNTFLEVQPESIDVIILALDQPQHELNYYQQLLKPGGILLQQSHSPFAVADLKNAHDQLNSLNFKDIQLLNFPQPDYPTGWRTAFMGIKEDMFKRLREKDIFNRAFNTHYYNFDVHKAALVLPEFIRKELAL